MNGWGVYTSYVFSLTNSSRTTVIWTTDQARKSVPVVETPVVEPVEPTVNLATEPVVDDDDGAESGDFGGAAGDLCDDDGGEGGRLRGEDETCNKCQERDNQEEIVVCDQCEGAYHIYCVDSMLEQVPEEEVS